MPPFISVDEYEAAHELGAMARMRQRSLVHIAKILTREITAQKKVELIIEVMQDAFANP